MILLIAFAFMAGVVTILSPCILPILPIVLSSSIGGAEVGKSRPFGVVFGFVLSFTFFTLFLSTIVRASGIPADSLRLVSVVVIAGFGASLLIPRFQILMERLFTRLAQFAPQVNSTKTGFWSGLLVGISLGLLWTPCVGPILASVISLSFAGTVTLDAFLITLAYSLGTAIPMFFILLAGQNALKKVPWLLANTGRIQKAFGVVMIITALGILTNVDRRFQTYILEKFPQYGAGLTSIEDNQTVRNALEKLQKKPNDTSGVGKPMFDVLPTASVYPFAPELIPGGEWFNTEPLTISSLRGNVVLVDFWTYTCINCIRTLPYLKSWHEKYEGKGLFIVGVHTPEFEFEKNPKNVEKAIADFGLKYPVMQDNDYATWRAYANRYWPAKYLIDKDGNIRYTHFGEGEYDETEEMIQKLLEESGNEVAGTPVDNPKYQVNARTPELYLGYRRIESLVSPERILRDGKQTYSTPHQIPNNQFAFVGEWTIGAARSMPHMGASLTLQFDAKEVFLVMRPIAGMGMVNVLLDETAVLGPVAGVDVKGGIVTVDTDRLYKLVRLEDAGRHTLTLEFFDDNLEIYAFTFG